MKKALILGVNGQDGSYLAELLVNKGYSVHGMYRHSSSGGVAGSLWRLRDLLEPHDRIVLHPGDLLDTGCLRNLIDTIKPDEVYNMADQDHVGYSYKTPLYSMEVTATGVAALLEVVRRVNKNLKVFQPISATVFGAAPPPQNELTPFAPASPYACAKAAAYYLCQHYRREHELFVATAIYFNHDSPRRCGDYLLQKICRGAVEIARGQRQRLDLYDQSTLVDIGYAPEYVEAAWKIMQLCTPDDFVVGTGSGMSVTDLAVAAFRAAEVKCPPEGWLELIEDSGEPRQPAVHTALIADTTKAKAAFGWEPKTFQDALVRIIVAKFQNEDQV